ncbi:hypothetical protein P7C71_g5346, partial [Lecanoromycetidae sp. Uapishka_2]
MSRRAPPNAAAERAAQNQQTIKTLLKLEGNKTCADCKRNKHPATLDAEGDDDVPLNVVQEKAKLERGASLRAASTSSQPLAPPPRAAPPVDLFGDAPEPPARPSTTDTPGTRLPPPKSSGPPKQTKAADSLLGLDFFGGPPSSSSGRPSSSASTPGGSTAPSRPDLKQSILSLYASAPKPQPPPQHERQPSFGGMQSAPASGFGGLDDAFGGLNFNPPTSPPAPQQQPKSDPFAGYNNPTMKTNQRASVVPPQVTSPPLSGGGFFDAGPKLASKASIASKPPQIPQAKPDPLSSNDFGDFNFASSPAPAPVPSKTAPSASNDLFGFTEPSPPANPPQPTPVPQKPSVPAPASYTNSAFNLSAPTAPSQPAQKPAAPVSSTSGLNNMDAWGSSEAWATPEPTTTAPPKPKPAAPVKAPSIPMSSDFSAWGGAPASSNNQTSNSNNGWGSTPQAPKVAPDEDFGGWSSAAPETPARTNAPPVQNKPASSGSGFGGSDDLFSNVWE